MPDGQETTTTNVIQVVTNIRNYQGKLKAEYAEITFTGEVEVKRLPDQYFRMHQDSDGKLRIR